MRFSNAQDLKQSWVTSGIISSITYPAEGQPYEFRMNVFVLPGNSGGPVFTSEGYVVGMVKGAVELSGQILSYTPVSDGLLHAVLWFNMILLY